MTPLARVILPAALVAAVLAAVPVEAFDLDRFTLPKEVVVHLAAIACAAALARGADRRWDRLDGAAALVALVSLASALAAANHWLAAHAALLTVSAVAVFAAARRAAQAGHRAALLAGVAAAAVAAAATGLLQAYGAWAGLASARAPGGTLGNRNFMAHLAVLGVPALAWLAATGRPHARWAATAGTGLIAAAVVLSRSRAAWLGAAAVVTAGCAVLVLAGRPRGASSRHRLAALALAAVGGAALALSLPNRLEWKSRSPYLESLKGVANYREGSGRGRLVQYGNTLRMAVSHPALGAGPGNWPVAYPRFATPGDPAFSGWLTVPTNPWPSSDWMALAGERGFAGVAAVAWLALALAAAGWRASRGAEPALGPNDLATAAATTAGVLVMGSLDAVLLQPAPVLLVATALGAVAPGLDGPDTTVAEHRRWRWATRSLLAAAVAGALLAGTATAAILAYEAGGAPRRTWAARLDPGNFRLRMLLAEEARRRGRGDEARSHARAALRLMPDTPSARALARSVGATE